MFYPADETMLNNKKHYMKLPKVKKDFFMPRKVTCILHLNALALELDIYSLAHHLRKM